MSIRQLFILLCFAFKINKFQERIIAFVGVYLPNHMFSHGQLYIALSRGISMETTKVLVGKGNLLKEQDIYTCDVLYKEDFLNV